MLGRSSFLASPKLRFGLDGFAKKIKAEIVTISEDYHSTETKLKPVEAKIPETTYHERYVSTEEGYIKQTEEITTYKTVTNYVPHDVDYYEYDVSYWAKLIAPPILGVQCVDLIAQELRDMRVTHGIKVIACYKGGPAWHAGLMSGDVILKIDLQEIRKVAQFAQMLELKAGQEVELTIDKNGEKSVKKVQLNLNPRDEDQVE